MPLAAIGCRPVTVGRALAHRFDYAQHRPIADSEPCERPPDTKPQPRVSLVGACSCIAMAPLRQSTWVFPAHPFAPLLVETRPAAANSGKPMAKQATNPIAGRQLRYPALDS